MHRFVVAVALLVAASAEGGAQASRRPVVPRAYQPPPGMCRIWLDGVPPAQQPAPTDCATAVRNRPANGHVLFGDDAADDARGRGRSPRTAQVADDDRDGTTGDVERYARPFRRGGDVCVDQNRDGVCDDAQGTGGVCVDRDRDGVCDDLAEGGGGRALPAMLAAAQYAHGERPADVMRWIGAQSLTARLSDVGRNGTPSRVVWLNDVGDVVQIWLDRDRDGRADRVEFYKDGRRVQSVGQY